VSGQDFQACYLWHSWKAFAYPSVLILSKIVLKMNTTTPDIGDLLLGQTRGQILALLLGAPDESFFLRQIARHIGASAGTARRELNLLADAGLIVRSVLGSQVFYRANRDHPVFPELRALLAKTMGVFELLKKALSPLAARIAFAFAYGSVARGEDNAASDIDLMGVGAVSLDDILDVVSPLEKQLRRPVNPTIYSLKDLKQRYRAGNHFLRSLKNTSKVFLIGNEDDFRKALATRMVQS
jgi:predicted nucleotidyltransferase